jgi:MFS family permease
MPLGFFRELGKVWRRQNISWRTVVIRQVFSRFFSQMTLQYSNIYITELGASPVELGTVNSTSGLGSALISLPLGHMRDRYSVRKVYLFGVALLTLSPFFYAIASEWEMVIPAILISGFGIGLGSCVMYCDLCLPNEDRATGKALCEGIGALPTLLAPTVAAFLVTIFGGINIEGMKPLFWLQFLVEVTLVIYAYIKVTEIERPERETRRTSPLNGFAEVFHRGIAPKRWLLFLSINMFTMTIVSTFRYPFAYEVKGADQFVIGGMTTSMILTEAVFSTPLGRLTDKIGRKKIFYSITPFFCLANIVLVLATSPGWLILAGLLMGFRMLGYFSYGSMTPELVPRDCMGRWRGLIGLFTGIASIPAPIIGGYVWEHMGPVWVFIIPTLIDLLILIPVLHSVPETLKLNRGVS